jgi:hypothetical protein
MQIEQNGTTTILTDIPNPENVTQIMIDLGERRIEITYKGYTYPSTYSGELDYVPDATPLPVAGSAQSTGEAESGGEVSLTETNGSEGAHAAPDAAPEDEERYTEWIEQPAVASAPEPPSQSELFQPEAPATPATPTTPPSVSDDLPPGAVGR